MDGTEIGAIGINMVKTQDLNGGSSTITGECWNLKGEQQLGVYLQMFLMVLFYLLLLKVD